MRLARGRYAGPAALIPDGEVIAAGQEERFTRKQHGARFPTNAVQYRLEEGGLKPGALDHVVFYEKPFLKFERPLESYLALAPRGLRSFQMALPLWIREKLFQKDLLSRELKAIWPDYDWASRLLFAEHPQSHAGALSKNEQRVRSNRTARSLSDSFISVS